MRAFLLLAGLGLAVVGCLDDASEEMPAAKSSAAVGPAPEWTVTSGVQACDDHLRNACPHAAIACLGDSECKGLATCIRECTTPEKSGVHTSNRDGDHSVDNDDNKGDCVAQCGRDHRPPWRLYDPFNECAIQSDACR